jgi:hypothetical protein
MVSMSRKLAVMIGNANVSGTEGKLNEEEEEEDYLGFSQMPGYEVDLDDIKYMDKALNM